MATTPELVILRFLARRVHATASAIGAACAMAPGEVRARLVMLESQRLVSGRQDKADGKPQRVYVVTHEGRRKAGISDMRAADDKPRRRPTTYASWCCRACLTSWRSRTASASSRQSSTARPGSRP